MNEKNFGIENTKFNLENGFKNRFGKKAFMKLYMIEEEEEKIRK